MPVCVVGTRLAGGGGPGLTSGRRLSRHLPWRVLFCVCYSGCVPMCGGLCMPGVPGPSWAGDTKAAGGV